MSKLTHSELIHLLVQLALMLSLGRVLAEVARRLHQPAVVGELLAGILLGPTILGTLSPDLFQALFPHTGPSSVVLDGFTNVSVIMLLFIAGLEVDLHLVFQQGRLALSTSTFGLLIPFFLGFWVPWQFPELFSSKPGEDPWLFPLFLGTAMSISALPVIVRILMDLKIFKTRIGMLVVASAMANDLIGWMIFSVILAFIGRAQELSVVSTMLLTVGFAAFMLTIGRGLLNRILPWINKRLAWPGGLLSLSLAACFAAAALTAYIGIHAVFGAFMVGIAFGDSEHMSERAKEIVHQFINNIFAPLFFVGIGIRVNFIEHFDPVMTLIILVIAFAGKIAGSGIGARLGGFTWRDSMAVGFGMNARGAMEIILGLVALENGLINQTVFVSLVIMALVTSMTSGPLMRSLLRIPAS